MTYVSYDSDNLEAFEDRELAVNMAKFKNMKSSDRHGTTASYNLDRTLVHELVHGLMAPNLKYFNDLPTFLAEGGTAELIHGVDDERYSQIISCVQDPDTFDKILDSTFTESIREVYSGGYVFMRYFAKQAAADNTVDYDTYRKTISTDSNGDFITNYWNTVTMKGGADNDSITNNGGKYTVYQIGTSDGKDTVTGFNDGETIQITKGTYSAKKSGSDVVVSVGKNKLTLKDAVNKEINFINAKGKTTTKTYSAKVSPLWFADDNNFSTTDNLSSLVKNKSAAVYSSDDLDYSSDLTSLKQKDNLMTYISKK